MMRFPGMMLVYLIVGFLMTTACTSSTITHSEDGDKDQSDPDGDLIESEEEVFMDGDQVEDACLEGDTSCLNENLMMCIEGRWILKTCEEVCRVGFEKDSSGCDRITVDGVKADFCICVNKSDGDVEAETELESEEPPDGDVIDGDLEIPDGDLENDDMDTSDTDTDEELSVQCQAVCTQHCGNIDGCNCGGCELGKSCEQNVCVPADSCTSDSQCGQPFCDPYSECQGFDAFCDETGVKIRNCYEPVCPDGSCTVYTSEEDLVCDRDTDGSTCGVDQCAVYGACDYEDVCDKASEKCRNCFHLKCQSGTCIGGASFSDCTTEGCTRETDNNDCDLGSGMGSGSCLESYCVYSTKEWTDPATSLTWKVWPWQEELLLSDAESFCTSLGEGWRLPNISELRSLIRGCPSIETGGACGVIDICPGCGVDSSCLASSIECFKDECLPASCQENQGPADGCYWASQLKGPCDLYWSSSDVIGLGSFQWIVIFNFAQVRYHGYVDFQKHFRCVR